MSRAPEGDQKAHGNATIPTLSVCSGKDCTMEGRVNGVSASVLVDTGAAATVLSKSMWDRVKKPGVELHGAGRRRLVGVQGTPLQLYGTTRILLEFPPEKFWVDVVVADTPTADMILGRDFLHSQKCTIEMGDSDDTLHVRSRGHSISMARSQTPPRSSQPPLLNVILQESVIVPPCSEMEVMGRTPDEAVQKPWLVQGGKSQRWWPEPLWNQKAMRYLYAY